MSLFPESAHKIAHAKMGGELTPVVFPLAKRGVTDVTNIFTTAQSDFNQGIWGYNNATLLTDCVARFNGVTNQQLGRDDLVLIAGRKYLVALQAKALTATNTDSVQLYPAVVTAIYSGPQLLYSAEQPASSLKGTSIALSPEMQTYFATFYACQGASAAIPLISDYAGIGVPFDIEFGFFGVYDITGLSGVIHDTLSDKYFNLGSNVHFIGDSLSDHLWQCRDILGIANVRAQGQRVIRGTVSNSSAVITNVSAADIAGLATGMTIWGTGSGALLSEILSIGATTVTMVDAMNATAGTDIGANGIFQAKFTAAGKTTTEILAQMNASFSTDPALKNYNTILWLGHNDMPLAFPGTPYATLLATAKANIAAITSQLSGDFRILSVLYRTEIVGPTANRTAGGSPNSYGSAAWIDDLNDWLAGTYGSKFVDVRDALLANNNGSATDIINIQNRMTPASLRSDVIHINDRGAAVVAAEVKKSVGTSWS